VCRFDGSDWREYSRRHVCPHDIAVAHAIFATNSYADIFADCFADFKAIFSSNDCALPGPESDADGDSNRETYKSAILQLLFRREF